ncbi:MAG: hypothetical protein IJE18_07105 [Bacteroidaceae bacterium]|nr:hypothetical protein [Bacteroidaceae bacterium]
MAQLYYYYSEALEEARKLCEEINGYIPEQEVTVDDITRFTYIDRRIPSWCGETGAIEVQDANFRTVEVFGYFTCDDEEE